MSASTQSGTEKAAGPKVLRIGIVQRGKIIEERELKKRETVSIGTHQKATFQVTSDALPKVFNLFDYDGKEYHLRFTGEMDGRVQLDGQQQVNDFRAYVGSGQSVRRGDADSLRLSDDSRGKVMIGDLTVLFQFKALSPEGAKVVLPSDIRGSLLENIDMQFALIFVITAIVQISIVGYARSLPYVEPTSIEQVGTKYQRLIMPDRIPEAPRNVEEATAEAEEEKGEEEKPEEKAPVKEPTKKPAKQNTVSAEEAARARKAAIASKVAGKGLLRVLGARREGGAAGGALSDVFEEGGAVGDLGSAFSGIAGVDIAEEGGAAGTRGGGAGEQVGIGTLVTEGGGSVKAAAKQETEVRGSAQAGGAPEVDGDLSQDQINGVMKRQLKALRSCYENALKRDKSLSGKIVIEFEILESGKTSNVKVRDVSLKSGDVADCIARRAKFWRFPKPDGGSVLVAYPVVFTPSS
ncbi:MAG: AgmX/PglI C-terminal domain-containing protein [Deltaproteobacteria bacterium]|nr:AgmX/PglI C-terminal domain-containing protein [Deltaproteobacteria bacterium]